MRVGAIFIGWVALFVCSGMVYATASAGAAEAVVTADLATAPNVPAPIARTRPAHVVVQLEAKEFVGTLANGIEYEFWSFNGTVPGPMIRVRVGDTVELHLSNAKDSKVPHNIDLHAVNGPGGGAAATLVNPGNTAAFEFKALAPGLFVYHCASPVPNIPMHIANGMYGLILVEPERGLPKVEREYYVMRGEFFTQPADRAGLFRMSMDKGLAEHPDAVVFNGREGALLGEHALTANAGDRVRIFFGNIGPNGAAAFHVIGEIFDRVYLDGGLDGAVSRNVQTTLVPAGGATIVEFKLDGPGTYLLVDHSVFRVAKGAVGALAVTGADNPGVFRPIAPR